MALLINLHYIHIDEKKQSVGMILKKCVTLQFCAKLLCTKLVEIYKKIKNGTTIM